MAGTGDVGDVASGGGAGGGSGGAAGGSPAGVWPGLPYVAPLGVFLVLTMIEKELYGLLTKPGAYGVKLLATVRRWCGFVVRGRAGVRGGWYRRFCWVRWGQWCGCYWTVCSGRFWGR